MTLLLAASAGAQVRTVGLAGHFMSENRFKVSHEDRGTLYVNSYMPLVGASLSYEANAGGAGSMFEVSYINGKLYSVDQPGDYYIESWNIDDFKDLTMVSAYYYYGFTLLSGHRLQFPLYFGLGVNYNAADPINVLSLGLAAKARARFYFTDKLAVFGGVGWKGSIASEELSGSDYRVKLDIGQRVLYFEAGLSFNIGM